MTHWSEGTVFENFKAGEAGIGYPTAPYEGMHWSLSPDNPAPPGFFVDRDGTLFASRYAGGGPATDDGLTVAATADRLLREAKAAGWTGGSPASFQPCGSCTPCRNQQPDRCIQPGSATAKARAVERDRWRQAAEDTMVLREAQAHAFSWVSTVDEEAERGRRRAEILWSLA